MTARPRRRATWSGLLVLVAVLAGCASPAGFASDAGRTAQDGLSQVRTSLIAMRTGLAGDLPDGYLVTVLEDAEDALSSTQESFRSQEPPADAGSDRLRAELGDLLTRGTEGVARARIAAERGDRQQVAAVGTDLDAVADALERFEKEHQS
ncbi:hypothetical protein ACQEVB_18410 [Pseudonocardia sp. CA-107938]|uniref:hypothetical protein n=1 Tax=Pseudonocardia sp. CA-107938 TaxID=3240021 RepID=UPI003D8A48BF